MTEPGKTPAYFAAKNASGVKLRPDNLDFVPRLGDAQSIITVALTAIILGYGGIFGPISILIFYGMWLSRIKYRGAQTLRPTRDAIYVLLLPAFCCLSAIWSAVPPLTLYSALEYTSSVLCAIIIGRLVRTFAFLRGLSLGVTIVLIASIASKRYGVDPFSGYYSLVGLFGSKNQVGLFAEIGIFIATLIFFYPQKRLSRLFYAVIPFAVACVALFLSKSASSVMSLMIVFAMIFAMYLITRLPRNYRGFACAITLVWFVGLFTAGAMLDWQQAIFSSFGKDSTLTGRTTLWAKGMQAAWHKPILGHGFYAFWVQGNPIAEQLWYQFDIGGRAGFHFHNMYIEAFVELGMVGVFLLVLLLAQNLWRSFALILRHGMVKEYVYPLGMSVMFLVRSFVEVDLIGTFGIGVLVYYANLPRLATFRAEQKAAQNAAQNASKGTAP